MMATCLLIRHAPSAQMLGVGVVCEPAEGILHRLGQLRIEHDAVRGCLACELGIEVGDIQHRFLLKVREHQAPDTYASSDK